MNGLTRRHLLAAMATACAIAPLPGQAAAPPLRIGIIGSGKVGSTLGGLWVKAGYQVMFSARTLGNAQDLAKSLGPLASAGTPRQAVDFGDVVLLAVPYYAIPTLGPQLNPGLKGKILLDATNPFAFRDGAIAATAARDGAGATTQRYFPDARVVRGFNSLDMSAIRAQAHRPPPLMAVPIAGDDPTAVKTVVTLAQAAGLDPVVTGNLASSLQYQPGHKGFELQDSAAALKAALHIQ
ncbi:NADPH-dependent F420 reductase [Acetobacter garciniae]|nr:NAD(P)-binding domain-containing protein [Acetobacter garciniae]